MREGYTDPGTHLPCTTLPSLLPPYRPCCTVLSFYPQVLTRAGKAGPPVLTRAGKEGPPVLPTGYPAGPTGVTHGLPNRTPQVLTRAAGGTTGVNPGSRRDHRCYPAGVTQQCCTQQVLPSSVVPSSVVPAGVTQQCYPAGVTRMVSSRPEERGPLEIRDRVRRGACSGGRLGRGVTERKEDTARTYRQEQEE